MEMDMQDGLLLRRYLPDYLRQKGLPTRKAFRCLNPNHEDKHPSMSYHQGGETVHCFACGVTYDLLDLVGMDYGLNRYPEKLAKAAELFSVASPERELRVVPGRQEAKSRRGDLPLPMQEDKAREMEALSHTGDITYFERRGISSESCATYGLFQTQDRAVFPVYEEGRCTGWCGRALDNSVKPRYQNSRGAIGLWNGDLLRQDGAGNTLCITEGIVDAILLTQMGFAAVSLCGSQNTGKLLNRLEQSPQTANTWRFLLCGDGDDAGRAMNQKLADKLSAMGLSARVVEFPEGKDVAAMYQQDRDKLLQLLEQTEPKAEGQTAAYGTSSAAALLDAFFAERDRRGGRSACATGVDGMDKLLDGGLHSGLYVLGAISSLGKTSLALQMADYIAEHQRDVLFITLEQSRFELMAKSLSRISAGLDPDNALTVRELLSGQSLSLPCRQLLGECRELYAGGAGGLFLREGVCDIGVGDIREMVREHQAARGEAPVVVVDYLQILKPSDARATDKQNVDRAVVELKRLSRDFDIPVLAVSSFNRENYKAVVSMEAFKESGAVEYSADVLLGLQLRGAGEKGFDVNEAKTKSPRELELVILKNRTGVPYAKIPLYYDAKFNRFWEARRVAAARLA